MTQTPPWTSRIGIDGETHTVHFAGEIDMAAADAVRALLIVELEQPGTTTVTADLTQLNFIDSAGLGALINAYSYAREAGQEFRVTNPAGAVARVMRITGVFGLLTGTADDLSEGPG
ncbi:STAS domain-containing protein [Actinoplanes sp. Pm04-4]|uniref:Anti-sigma factor antagonist n=1 Tax=Paractinoplanes pyxinae TaxID=2997416 RepID=A0ABT4BGY3_9ACTN|nr:STAS domain-containing protein [Actinoplanes pyxinae]MCY1145711.1 STAS domain-containing protein [Actinoplanes pyxinae]